MPRVYMAMGLSAIACVSMNCSNSEIIGTATAELHGVTYVDMYAPAYTTQRPLLCGQGRHYPEGTEMVFKHSEKKAEYHAVFPKGVTPPRKSELDNCLTLHGRFEAIQSTPDGKALQEPNQPLKRIPFGYRYFVVASWEMEK